MNGPVASAGSILYLSKVSGIKVPKSAKMMTAKRAMLTVALSHTPYPSKGSDVNNVEYNSVYKCNP